MFPSRTLFIKKLGKLLESMNIVITGGLGFLGSNLAKELYSRGHNIIILDKKRKTNQTYLPKKIKIYYCDINSENPIY